MKISIKTTYLLMVAVIALLGIVIVPTYAKFVHTETINDNNDIVKINLDFDIEISSIDQYEEITVKSGHSVEFNVDVFNNTDSNLYYGIWYKMIYPNTLPDSGVIQIGKIENTTTSTTGTVETKNNITASIGVINNTNDDIKIYIGVNSSTTSTSDIEYLDGKTLITGEVQELSDINIASITVDGSLSSGLPTNGYYDMTYECVKGSTLRWDPLKRTLTFTAGSYVKDSCDLTFTSSTEYPLLSEMEVGSYVAYVGEGGTVGTTTVNCQLNGNASSSTATDETEAPNSCLGQNAREDLDTSGYTYGYCKIADYKYYTTGWRIAYIDSNGKPVIVSAGSPECNSRTSSTVNATYIKMANTKAMKYCNSDLVDGDCSCLDSDSDGYCDCTDSDDDGLCDEIENNEVDAWAISDIDFYNMTKAISGYGKRLASSSSSLGDSGGSLGTTLYCYYNSSYEECGYNNDLIDNGGYYWFAARYASSGTYGVYWEPSDRFVYNYRGASAYGLRPVIKLASTVIVTGGSGTMEDPYELDRDDNRDAVRPVCSITGPTTAPTTGYIKNGQTLTYTLTCTDDSGSLGDSTITTSDLTSNNTSVMTITSIGTKTAVSNGYSWPITVTAGATTGSARILLNENAISDSVGNPNESLTSTQLVSVDNDGPTCGTVSVTAGTTTNTTEHKAVSNATVQVLCTDTLSGCSATSSSKTVSSNGSGTISITDKLGNSTSCSYNVSNVIYNLKITSTKYLDDVNNFKSCAGYWYKYKMVYTITATGSGLSSGTLCYSPSNGGATSGCGSYPNSDNYNYGCACFDSASTWTFYRSNECSYGKACNAKGLCVYKYQCTS